MSTYNWNNNLAQTTEHPFGIKVKNAKGSYIYDQDGKRYLDFISGIAVSNIGHGNPRVIQAIKDQTDKHLHVMVYGEFEQESPKKLACLLSQTLPDQLQCFYFLNSGTEANEAAIKLAKRTTMRSEIIAFRGAYHGNTNGSLSISDHESRKNAFRPLIPGVKFIRLNNFEDLKSITENTAGVFLETIQGDAGVRIPNKDFLIALRNRCNETGTLLIFDEIQCGIGRTGKFWAFEHFGVQPDIITAGKALGAGLPIGCLISSKEMMQNFSFNPSLGHITTFGGHPLTCAAAAAGLEVVFEEGLLEKSQEKALLMKELLIHPKIAEVRQIGLMLAVELENKDQVKNLVLSALEKGVILFWFLSTPNSFRIAPPLTITNDEIKSGISIIISLLDEV